MKDLLAVERVQARKSKKSSMFLGARRCNPWGNVEASERPPRRRASAGEKEKGPQCIQGGGDVHPGKLRHQIKSFSQSSEFRQVKDLLADERAQARKRKGPQCIQGGGDVHPGQVEAPVKVLLAVVRVQAS